MQVLLTADQIRDGVRRLAGEIAAAYGPRPVTIVGVLTGCVVLLADLIRQLTMPLRIDFIEVSSYRGATTRGTLHINPALQPDISGRDVLLVDDIFDTGHTLVQVVAELRALGARSIRTAVLLRKQGRQEVDFVPDYVGFDIPDVFVVGYGLDYRDEYRNLPYVAALEPDEIAGQQA
jgi:hypoxanthine phosphoribosyltransferase